MNAVLKQPELNLRPMAETDLSDVLQIEHAAYAFPWNRNIFKGCLREDYCCRVLELDGGDCRLCNHVHGRGRGAPAESLCGPRASQDGTGVMFC